MEAVLNFFSAHSVIISVMILFVSYMFIVFEKIPRVTIALLGAGLAILIGPLSQHKTVGGALNPDYFVNFIDFNVIFLIVSMMVIVNITTKSGVFNYLANEILKLTKGYPPFVLIALGVFSAFLSSFLDNVSTVILVLPVTFAIAKELKIDPFPFLITEIFATNIGADATLIGCLPNMIIGSAADFSFMDFIHNLAGVVALILFTTIGILTIIFSKKLQTSVEQMREAANINNSHTITDKKLLVRSMIVMGLVLSGFISPNMEPSIAAMIGASILLLFEKPRNILRSIEWNTVFLFVGLFIIIGGVEASGGIRLMADWILSVTHGSQEAASMLILWGSGLISGIVYNIPYTATMAPMLHQIQSTMGAAYTEPLWWCLSLGTCMGGNMTVIGAAANVVVSENAAKEGYPISFKRFFKYGFWISFVSLVISTIYILLNF